MKRLKSKLGVLATGFAATMLIIFYGQIKNGVEEGIRLCITAVIPSLYLFTVLSVFAVKTGIFDNSVILKVISRILWGTNTRTGGIQLLSLIGGYPVGATLVSEAKEKGALGEKAARRLVYSAVNAGPAFTVTLVGGELYASREFGIMLFLISATVATVTARINSRFLKTDAPDYCNTIPYGTGFTTAVSGASKALLNICGWVIMANAASALLPNNNGGTVLKCLCEVTTGVFAAKDFSPEFTAFLICFGGFSVHLQVLPQLKALGVKYRDFLSVKFLQGIAAAVICKLVLLFFPRIITVAAVQKPVATLSGSVYSCICIVGFVIMTAVFCAKSKKEVEKLENICYNK